MFPKKLSNTVTNAVVATKNGLLRGLVTEETYIFRGVRYAKAKRFHLPEPPQPWEGVQDALAYPPVCPEERTGVAHDQYYVPHYHGPQDEDCQFLNIWTQSVSEDAKRPVMVWIHGGLFDTGSAIELYAYDGEELSRFGNVVIVSVSHRLNVLGFLDLSAYSEEYRYSGNAGIADLVAALRWVRENIACFGGDPDNVTVFGQSGGGQKISALLQTPAADGLFHKGIIQSGMSAVGHRPGFGRINPATGAAGNHNRQEDARALAAYVIANLGISGENVRKIETVPYHKLARAGLKAKQQCREAGIIASWCPTFDGDYYMGDAMARGFRKESSSVPFIIGSNLGEFSGNATHSPIPRAKSSWTEEEVEHLVHRRFGENAEPAKAVFKKAYPDHPLADLAVMDDEFRKGVMDFARIRQASGCAAVYTYLFSLEMPYLGGTLPWHNCEEAYVLHNAKYLEASYIPGVSEQMQDKMTAAWVAFAETGDPNHGGIPHWQRYDGERRPIMVFDRVTELRQQLDDDLIPLFPNKRMGHHGGGIVQGGPRRSL